MDSYKYEELKMMLCEELEKIVDKGELTAGSLDIVHKLTDTVKNIDKIEMLDENEYSEDDGMYSRRITRGRDGYSSARRYTHPRYSSCGYDGGSSYRRYSRDNGRDDMMSRLGEMMEGSSDAERDILKRAMRALEKM